MLPPLSHLQYLVLENLAEAKRYVSARDVQQQLVKLGAGNRSLPAFYMFMDRLADAAFVKKREQVSDESRRTEVSYRIVAAGRTAMNASKKFYCKEGCTE